MAPLSNSYGEKHEKGILINLHLTNKDIARFMSTSRESVNRMVNELKKKNIIEIENGLIIIQNRDYHVKLRYIWHIIK
ncbi:helix-turn-helix domain-containing protein [Alkalihalobacillus sp. BA299]|uniref:helix-turn-helix domain-containing protein n=1 Tax=Alkalihalobacillus sp. BA299 TaxID=2815938 RepID=UPI0024693D73|nr:helix-turn-helix domain-containing protein [Alkalihalobacillus sp. BA299]